jgi:hypothetical protein
MKIIGVGLNKTGTTTLGMCLKHWKLRHTTWSNEAFDYWLAKDYSNLFRFMENFDCFEDWPWPLLYKEIDRRFPDAKFILTRRKSSEAWYRSLCKHAERTGPTRFRKHIYGSEMPHDTPAKHIAFYEKHNQSVREYFAERPEKLLEVCWEEGHGWNELANFLGYDAPNMPMPHANDRTQMEALVRQRKLVKTERPRFIRRMINRVDNLF